MVQIEKVVFDGLEAVALVTACVKMVIVVECGPRIAYFGEKEEAKNLLYWDKAGAEHGTWRLMGGHRVWLTRPYADESEDTYAEDNAPCKLELGENRIRVTAPAHPFTKMERGMEIRVIDDQTFQVVNFVKNAGDLIYSGGVWSPTCINPAGKVIRVPLGEDNVTWDLVKIVIPRIFAGNTVPVNDPQVTFTEREMIVKSRGILTKRCVTAPQGKISMEWPEEGIVFEKCSRYIRDGKYPLDGCNIAVFIGQDNWMGELETFGREQGIRPGETIFNEEQWTLRKISAC